MSRIYCPSDSSPFPFRQPNLFCYLWIRRVSIRSGGERQFPLFTVHAPRSPAFGFRFTPYSSFGPYDSHLSRHSARLFFTQDKGFEKIQTIVFFLFPIDRFTISLQLLLWPLFDLRVHWHISLLAHMNIANGWGCCDWSLFVYGNHRAQVPMAYGTRRFVLKGFMIRIWYDLQHPPLLRQGYYEKFPLFVDSDLWLQFFTAQRILMIDYVDLRQVGGFNGLVLVHNLSSNGYKYNFLTTVYSFRPSSYS